MAICRNYAIIIKEIMFSEVKDKHKVILRILSLQCLAVIQENIDMLDRHLYFTF